MDPVTRFETAKQAEKFAAQNDHLGYVHVGEGRVELDPERVKAAPARTDGLVSKAEMDKAIAAAVAAALAASKAA